MEAYSKSIKDLAIQGAEIQRAIKNKIRNLPDNPRIKRINKQCFVMSSANLGNNWSAEHHDFKATYRIINREIAKKSPQIMLTFLTELIETGKIYLSAQKYTLRPHKDVISYLKEIIK
jgi:hypothetical protein